MKRSHIDWLRRIAGDDARAMQPVRTFRAQAWLGFALRQSKCEWAAFTRIYIHRKRARSGIAEKWRKGTVLPTRQSATELEKRLPGTLEVFDSPLFILLEDRPFTLPELQKIAAPYMAEQREQFLIVWNFPNDQDLRAREHWVPTLHLRETSSLVRRGDIWGFITCLWVARYCEATGEAEGHIEALMDAYRAMPAALKEPWLAPHAEQLFTLVEMVRRRSPLSLWMFDVDLDVIKRQAIDSNHEPMWEHRTRDPATLRAVEIEDPILPAKWTPGRTWKKQKERRDKAKVRRA